ncbi:nucleotidyltransferase domain-containing protein [Natronolimnobius baerhuensis]|uniref:Nucleotidyltransferase n=1 Tax=Natronolimnobius baerhuensis TaxID=253108 RepID=A0A202E9K4_9EURY|nr:nucleotidyltransferase domain-containing protein [Natronolimnobius baerhuensis]OVE84904.1 nucleotidyltransferase [Natronolimnobius baerhuensis]
MPSVSTAVRERIDATLADLEAAHEIAIPLAVARGSRAWNGSSPDSDYDVGFVFVPDDLRQYAHLGGTTETIDDSRGEIELQGLSVRTFASLLADSNESALDLLRSPVQYRTQFDPTDLEAYMTRAYNPIDLYHDWRAIASTNYRKYLSDHLVRSDDEIFPILERTADGYLVACDDDGTGEETMTIAADDERFSETQTKPTVKRNLTITRAAMSAYYLTATGDDGAHELPVIDFEMFLDEQAPAVFEADRIDRARDLLERKRRGEGSAVAGDQVGREFAHPPKRIDPAVHALEGPDPERLNAFVDDLIAAVQ